MLEENMFKHNKLLSKYACSDLDAIYLVDTKSDFRTPFFRDTDRILYTLAFGRYMDKTQVFSNTQNDHITRRMEHVLYVSKIARTIGRALNLNEDLIEAASLAHDLGHTPFGHVGEAILNEISMNAGIGYFHHNIQSVRLLMYIENYGLGKDITLQTLDAIMCHNGEFVEGLYKPRMKTKEDFLKEYNESFKQENLNNTLIPMTLEGCVVRISDLIGYLGKDIEDAIRMNLVTFDDLPASIKSTLGTSTKEIINTIVLDIINNSMGKDYIKLSDNIYKEIKKLKDFNYKNIYYKANTKEDLDNISNILNTLYNTYLNDLNTNNINSNIVSSYLENMNDLYKKNNSNEQIVIDYIAGMTDDYAKLEYEKIIYSNTNNGGTNDY